jgi:aminoglycoside 3-N-acetyltransferase
MSVFSVGRLVERVLSSSPWVEVFVKTLYWRCDFINKFLGKHSRKSSKSLIGVNQRPINFKVIENMLQEGGIVPGDILIVHSSGVALSRTSLTALEICKELIHFLGPDGTLAAPAIPLFREESKGVDRLSDDICNSRLVYDVKRTRSWTGELSKAIMGMPGSVRSSHPLNSMVAVGKHAEAMMAKNISGDLLTPCGVDSSWKYCYDRNAKIVFLGVDASHNITMIHVAEDAWEDEWPVKNWYRERLFLIKNQGLTVDLRVRERHPKWSIYYAERTLQKDLLRHQILNSKEVDGLSIGICQSRQLIEFMNHRKRKHYPYWIPFWVSKGKK